MSKDINIIPKYPSPQIHNKTLNKTGPVEVITAVSFVFWMKTELGTSCVQITNIASIKLVLASFFPFCQKKKD